MPAEIEKDFKRCRASSIEELMLLVAAVMLYRIDVNAFRKRIEEPSYIDKVALAAE